MGGGGGAVTGLERSRGAVPNASNIEPWRFLCHARRALMKCIKAIKAACRTSQLFKAIAQAVAAIFSP